MGFIPKTDVGEERKRLERERRLTEWTVQFPGFQGKTEAASKRET